MDFDLTAEQRALLDALGVLLTRHAGPARARQLGPTGYDHELDAALAAADLYDLVHAEGAGPLEAALVVETVAAALGSVAVGAHALVGPAMGASAVGRPLALITDDPDVPVRFGPYAAGALVVRNEEACWAPLNGELYKPVQAEGYPFGHVHVERGTSLGPGSGARLLAWWRTSLASEAVGLMTAGLAAVTTHVKERRQFNRPISAYQAVQHRLAECAVLVEGVRWLARRSAWAGAPDEQAALAAAHASASAIRTERELHQFSGAIGLTREFDLHLWTTRLHAVRVELGGLSAHRRAVAASRWGFGGE